MLHVNVVLRVIRSFSFRINKLRRVSCHTKRSTPYSWNAYDIDASVLRCHPFAWGWGEGEGEIATVIFVFLGVHELEIALVVVGRTEKKNGNRFSFLPSMVRRSKIAKLKTCDRITVNMCATENWKNCTPLLGKHSPYRSSLCRPLHMRKSMSSSHSCNFNYCKRHCKETIPVRKDAPFFSVTLFAAKDHHAHISIFFFSNSFIWISRFSYDGPVQSSLAIILYYRRKQIKTRRERAPMRDSPASFLLRITQKLQLKYRVGWISPSLIIDWAKNIGRQNATSNSFIYGFLDPPCNIRHDR